jgi:E3 ubiquitin-protein ligase HERC2
MAWSGTNLMYGWGHNHRGQLGGVEGPKVKTPQQCDSLSPLKPIQICGGEQSLFIVTADGKVSSMVASYCFDGCSYCMC